MGSHEWPRCSPQPPLRGCPQCSHCFCGDYSRAKQSMEGGIKGAGVLFSAVRANAGCDHLPAHVAPGREARNGCLSQQRGNTLWHHCTG